MDGQVASPISPGGNPLAPLSPKHVQSTTKRALKGAQPLRDDVQDKVNRLQHRITTIDTVDGEVGVAISDLTEQQAQAYREIKTEFETRKRQLAAQMKAREEELCDMATKHFEMAEAALKDKKDVLAEEDVRVKACVTEGIEALGLDDAWFIQAYPDIQIEAGASAVVATRQLLQSKFGEWNVDFSQELTGNAKFGAQFMPAISIHGQVGGKEAPAPVRASSPIRSSSPTPVRAALPAPKREPSPKPVRSAPKSPKSQDPNADIIVRYFGEDNVEVVQ